jgi:VanZ family protein
MVTFAARLLAWALAAVIAFLSLVPPGLRPETGAPHDLEHFAIFALTGVAFGLGYDRRPLRVALFLVAFAAAIEIGQRFVPGRHARLSDFLVDALALSLGVLAADLIMRDRGTLLPR